MGQSALCQTGAGAFAEELVEHPGAACSLAPQACGCLPSKSANVQESFADLRCRDHEIIAAAECDSDDTSIGTSEADEGDLVGSHLVLARHRVFSPHLHAKFQEHYRIERLLGEGSYGNVYEATTLAPSGFRDRLVIGGQCPPRRVAVKCFDVQQYRPSPRQEAQDSVAAEKALRELASRRASFERERSILARLEHPHLVRMYECFEDKGHLWIVLELCRGGELYEAIAEKVRTGPCGGLDEQQGRLFFRQMLYAASYLHACHIVHRDVKTENFLLLGEPGTQHGDVLKLCDFGTAVVLSPEHPRAMERIGTLSYTAPEVYERRGATVLADAWSLGVVLYVILVGASPFRIHGDEPRDLTVRRIQAGEYDQSRAAWLGLSRQAQDLVQRFLLVDESVRLTSTEALRHPWVDPGDSGGTLQPVLHVAEHGRSAPSTPRANGAKEPMAVLGAAQATALLQLLTRFARLDALQQLVLVVCAQMASEAELLPLQQPIPWYNVFFALDTNEDGRLDFREFVQGLRALMDVSPAEVPDEHLDRLARALDLDCSGTVDWVEWAAVALLSSHGACTEPEPLRTAFRLLDRPSGDGLIGAADLLAVVSVGASNGASYAAMRGRDAAHAILGKWANGAGLPSVQSFGQEDRNVKSVRPQQRRASSVKGPPPSLQPADLRRALEAAVVACHVEEANTSSILLGPSSPLQQRQGDFFQCCMGPQKKLPAADGQVLIRQQCATCGSATPRHRPVPATRSLRDTPESETSGR